MGHGIKKHDLIQTCCPSPLIFGETRGLTLYECGTDVCECGSPSQTLGGGIPFHSRPKLRKSETITSMKDEGNKTLERAVKSGRKKLCIFPGSSGTHCVAGRKKAIKERNVLKQGRP